MHESHSTINFSDLKQKLQKAAFELGINHLGFALANPGECSPRLQAWLDKGYQGSMDYMARHAELRKNPEQLVPNALSVISVTVNYLPHKKIIEAPEQAAISRYAQGRDYHKVVRQRLQKLADWLATEIGPFGYRVFSDSAPVFEVEYARQAGLGWRGKHTLLLNRQGSWHFLGEILTDLPLPPDSPMDDHCGKCTRCLDACPTGAIVAPYEVDARRCISYLTIEHHGSIPEPLRPLLGNRIYGCDDCQLCCPWNRFAQTGDAEFTPRHGLDASHLLTLFAWTERQFDERLAGNPIRRIGHARWLRNIAIALGNARRSGSTTEARQIETALISQAEHPDPMVREHVLWALSQVAPVATGREASAHQADQDPA